MFGRIKKYFASEDLRKCKHNFILQYSYTFHFALGPERGQKWKIDEFILANENIKNYCISYMWKHAKPK